MIRLVCIIAFLFVLFGSVETAYAKPNPKSYLERGDLELGKNKVDGAIISYTKAIQVDPFSAAAYVRRAMARMSKG